MGSEFTKAMKTKRGRPKKGVSMIKKDKVKICGGECVCTVAKDCMYAGRISNTFCCGYYDYTGVPRTLEPMVRS